MRKGVALLVALLVVAACGGTPQARRASPSPSISPSPSASPSPEESPSPTPSPTAVTSPVGVPAWAALHASCAGQPVAQEAVLQMQSASSPVLADVTNATAPRTLCGISGGAFQPDLVTQTMISWYASQGSPGTAGTSVIAILDLFNGTSAVAASWTGGGFLDGLHAWSPDRGFLAYLTSDATEVRLHVLSGGGDRVVASLGAIPGRGISPTEDDAYLAFSPDGAYLALEQTFAGGDELQVRRTIDGSIAFSLARATMATWGSTGSRLFYRAPLSGLVQVWDSTKGVSQAFGQALSWIRPRAATGTDTTLAFTVRDSAGMPHTWLYSHDGRSGGQLPNARSSPAWLSSTSFFYAEEAACGSTCGPGPAWQPDGKTFVFDTATQTETASKIGQVFGSWPRPGQT